MTEAPFRLLLRVRYGECDAQNVVFNTRYGDFVDVAVTEYWRYTLGHYQALLDQGLDAQVVHLGINWQSSATFDDVLAIDVSTEKVGTTSYTLQVTMTNADSGVPVANAVVVYVMIDAAAGTKAAVPDNVRESLLAGAAGTVVDQSGGTAR